MKLSTETIAVLKNFASINQGIEFKKGKKIKTISAGKTVLAEAHLTDEFPENFCIYDLNQFLSVYSLFKEGPELDFDTSNIVLKNGKTKIKYRKTAKEMIVLPPDKELKMTNIACEFVLSEQDFIWIMKTANILSSPNISFVSDGEMLSINSFDASDDSAHIQSIEIGDNKTGNKFNVVFKTENIKMIPGSYDVVVSSSGISHFKNKKDPIEYWVAVESKQSSFN